MPGVAGAVLQTHSSLITAHLVKSQESLNFISEYWQKVIFAAKMCCTTKFASFWSFFLAHLKEHRGTCCSKFYTNQFGTKQYPKTTLYNPDHRSNLLTIKMPTLKVPSFPIIHKMASG